MTNLVSAYQRKDIGEFERILKGKCLALNKDGRIAVD